MDMPTTARHRVLAFDNAPNFRELGGYRNRDGRVTRWGAAYRSSHLASLSPADDARLQRLNIGEVFDLRRGGESARFPNRIKHPVQTHSLDIDVGSVRRFNAQLRAGMVTREFSHATMIESYQRYVTDFGPTFQRLLQLLARPRNHAVLIHCMVGKDRTGVAVALLLTALRVPFDVVLEDYLLTRSHYPKESIIDQLGDELRERGVVVERGALEPFCTVCPEYLQAAFDEMERAHGGVERYMHDVLQVTPAQQAALAAAFLDP